MKARPTRCVRFVRSFLPGLVILSGSAVVCLAAEPPPAPSRAEVEAVLHAAARVETGLPKQLTVVLLADAPDHGSGAHGYALWQKRWSLLLGGSSQSDEKQANLHGPPIGDPEVSKGAGQVTVTKAWHWPTDEQFESADVIVAFSYLRWTTERIERMRSYLHRGGGLVVVHPASWTLPEGTAEVADLLGIGGYEFYRHGPVDVQITAPEHPICLGLPARIRLHDETYWPPTPAMEPDTVTVLAVSHEKISPESPRTSPQPVLWTYQCGKGRVFGCQPGHYHWTFDNPYYRIILLRGIAWAAQDSPYRFDELALRDARTSDSD